MSTFSQMNVFTKLVAGFSAVVVLLVGLGIFSLYEISGENDHVALLSENSLPAVLNSLEMQSSLRAIRLGDYRAATALSAADIDAASQQVDQAIAEYRHSAAQYEPLINDADEKSHYAGQRQAARPPSDNYLGRSAGVNCRWLTHNCRASFLILFG